LSSGSGHPGRSEGARLGSRFSCLGLLLEHDALTPGDLASQTGLSSSAVTTVLDRLERAGFVRREPDPKDRRRTVLRVNQGKVDAEIAPLMASFQAAMGRLMSGYAPEQTAAIVDFLVKCTGLFREEAALLREGGERANP